ncbi:hypothetical protein AZE42_09216 [Rhizopogon vesiculosus]|uniref:Uncharacterized protein n=1 Tax=Rhizopogon vesiculosus TaxID=180088 RepID=A0A1J8QIH7_9AGAM|nr:hypothetical protein AZE42_09216 [Rhizopogon vesiculosus]
MNVAGPSGPHAVPRARARNDCEEDPIHSIEDSGDALSDHEVAYALLMQNAPELAQRLAVEAGRRRTSG